MKFLKKIFVLIIKLIFVLIIAIIVFVSFNIFYPVKNNVCKNSIPLIDCLEKRYPIGMNIESAINDLIKNSGKIKIEKINLNKYIIVMESTNLTPRIFIGYIIVEEKNIKEYTESRR